MRVEEPLPEALSAVPEALLLEPLDLCNNVTVDTGDQLVSVAIMLESLQHLR